VKLTQICVTAALSVVGCPTLAWSNDLTGQASVIDGDTLEIYGTRVRLTGIDAPENRCLQLQRSNTSAEDAFS
jgi:endonuclease YncB( thermonuclease family)